MKLTLTQLTNQVERICDWRDDWEQRWDDAVAARWLADNALAVLEAEGELIRRKIISMADRIPGCLGGDALRRDLAPQKETSK